MATKFTLKEQNISVELGKYAKQAEGSAWVQRGGTIVLATVVSAPSSEFPGFLPLSVDYREQFSAAGRIPGGYFKREGRSTEKEILTSRLIDRSIRPLFPETFFDQVQVIISVLSVDKEYDPASLALLATSIALTVSPIPFLGPIGVTQVARSEGEWQYNPLYSVLDTAEDRILVAGTHDGVCMVEGRANDLQESEFVDILFKAHETLKQQVEWQQTIAKDLKIEKRPASDDTVWKQWSATADAFLTEDRLNTVFTSVKTERRAALSALREEYMAANKEKAEEDGLLVKFVDYIYDSILKKKLTTLVLKKGNRVDGRDYTTVRDVSCGIGELPSVHGSALFQRGGTQALVTTTLGSGNDKQRIENLMGDEINRTFMLHYNFPPFSVGEARMLRGPARREIGHGALAASALRSVLPDDEKFPYTIRVVADILESDGSSSMATVCGSTLSLMDAGVPISKMIAGVAMGLLRSSEGGDFQAITDITGFEDAFGLMDFKVAGSDKGITAIQMDIKHKGGLPREVFERALSQARDGRLEILGVMRETLSAPKELSELVPQIVAIKINKDKIGAVIGSGGKTIREIQETTGATIEIEDDGTVKVFGPSGEGMDKTLNWIKVLAGQINRGDKFAGIVRRITDFGLFVGLVPGVDGLVHISAIPREDQRNMEQLYPIGSELPIEVMDYDVSNGRIRLKIINK